MRTVPRTRRRTTPAWFAVLLVIAPATPATGTMGVEWVRQFGTPDWDWARGVSIDRSSGITYVASGAHGRLPGERYRGDFDAVVHALDREGNVRWVDEFGSRGYDAARQTASDASGVYVVGITEGHLGGARFGREDGFVRKYAPSGEELWTVQFGTPRRDQAVRIVIDDAHAYVVGHTWGVFLGQRSRGAADGFIASFSLSDGSLSWLRQFGTRRPDAVGNHAWSNAVAIDGPDLYTVSRTRGSYPGETDRGSLDVAVHRFTTEGRQVWVSQFGTDRHDVPTSVETNGSDVFVGGFTRGAFRNQPDRPSIDGWVRRMDAATGSPIWTRQFGGPDVQEVDALAVTGPSVFAVGATYGTLDGLPTIGGADMFVREMTVADGSWTRTRLFGTRVTDVPWWATLSGTTMVVAGGTEGAFPGQENRGGFDIVVWQLAAP